MFDPEAAVLRLAREDFLVLAAVARDPRDAVGPLLAERVEALTAAGAIIGGEVHPTLRSAFAAVNAALCRLSVEWLAGRADGWVDMGSAVLLVEPDEGPEGELVVVHPTFLPVTLARLVGFPASRGRWRATVRWRAAGGDEARRVLEVLGAGESWLLRSGEGAAWESGAPTTVWRRLVTLLPRTDELAPELLQVHQEEAASDE